LRKAIISFIMSVRMEQLSTHYTDFHGIWALFENLSGKFKFHSYLTRIIGTLREDQCTFFMSRPVLVRMRNVPGKSCTENQTINFLFSNFFLYGASYEIVWENVVEPERPQIDSMAHVHFTLGTQGYKHTLRICSTYWFSSAAVVVWKRLSVTFYVDARCLSLIF
jgi:hypothetical protein